MGRLLGFDVARVGGTRRGWRRVEGRRHLLQMPGVGLFLDGGFDLRGVAVGASFDIDPLTADGGRMMILTSEQGTTTTVELVGECDLAQQEELRLTIGRVLADRPEWLVLDLSRLSFIDSSGIHVIIELSERAAREECRLLICPGPRAVQRVFELCGLTTRLPFVGDGTGPGPELRDAVARSPGAAGSGGSSSLPAARKQA